MKKFLSFSWPSPDFIKSANRLLPSSKDLSRLLPPEPVKASFNEDSIDPILMIELPNSLSASIPEVIHFSRLPSPWARTMKLSKRVSTSAKPSARRGRKSEPTADNRRNASIRGLIALSKVPCAVAVLPKMRSKKPLFVSVCNTPKAVFRLPLISPAIPAKPRWNSGRSFCASFTTSAPKPSNNLS